MRFFEGAGEPGVAVALDGIRGIVEADIAEDFGAGWIGGANFGAAVKVAIRLVKVGGLFDVGGNEGIVFADFGDAVYLNGKENWDAVGLQLAGESNRFRAAPTVAVDDDASVLFFVGREFAVVIDVEETQNFLMRSFAAMVFENFDVNLRRIFLAEALGELDAAVDGIGVADETADEADDDRR